MNCGMSKRRVPCRLRVRAASGGVGSWKRAAAKDMFLHRSVDGVGRLCE